MTKRRADEILFHHTPSKRWYPSLCSLETQFESMDAVGGVNPPSLLALLGSRCRKRPHYFEDPAQEQEMPHHRKIANNDRNQASDALAMKTSGSFQDRRTSTTISSSKKRPREECVASQTDIPIVDIGNEHKDVADDDSNSDLSTFNSFQFWKVPLPELDLSLLDDADNQSQPRGKPKVKESNLDAMET